MGGGNKLLFDEIVIKKPIIKGWSCDKKYCVTVGEGTKYLLRITPYDKSESRNELFEILKRVSSLHIPMCKPIEIGTCESGVYILHTWVDGKDAEDVIPLLAESEQYAFGLKAGAILKLIHSIPAPETQEAWHVRFNRKTDRKIKKYRECGIRFDGDDKVMEYLVNNRDVLKDRPQTFQHGDYHIGNMMIENGELVIIDFDSFDFGDPWEELNRIVWCAQSSPCFATGMIDGYFDKCPSIEFWKCLAFYICSNTLSSIYWAIDFGQSDLDVMMKQSQDVLSWYDNFQRVVPNWYITPTL
ncbi:MAG: phosphotransferase [Longicatena sp.]|uniref:phosphotransferase family protein n=1 Tax=Anaerorhabdus sp. TaxID=1872524 RepID=UPI002FC9112A